MAMSPPARPLHAGCRSGGPVFKHLTANSNGDPNYNQYATANFHPTPQSNT